MNASDYLMAWGIYAGAALGCMLVFWWLTSGLWRALREPLRVALMVLLITPTVVDQGRELLAPAIAVLSMDLLFKVSGSSVRAMADLAMFGAIGALAYALFVLGRWLLERAFGDDRPVSDPRTLRERLDEDDEPPLARKRGERITPRL